MHAVRIILKIYILISMFIIWIILYINYTINDLQLFYIEGINFHHIDCIEIVQLTFIFI